MDFKLEELVNMYGEKLLRYAASILYNYQDAEDIVQEVFIAVYQKPGAFKGGNLNAWLYKITYNKCVNKLRRRKFLFFEDTEKQDEIPTPPQQTGLSEPTLQALGKLKPQDRALLYARIIEGYSYEELAIQMNATPQALRKRYERAKTKVAGYLTAKGENCEQYL